MRKLDVNIEEFNNALEKLNEKLEAKDLSISINAIGGYAMLTYGLRSANDYTEDIDSVTEKYKPEICDLIKEVSDEMNLQEDWLNTSATELEEVKSSVNQMSWNLVESFSNIKLYVCDIDSLILLKAKAVDMGGLVPRKTDKKDLIKLLKSQNIYNMDDLEQSQYSYIMSMKNCKRVLSEIYDKNI